MKTAFWKKKSAKRGIWMLMGLLYVHPILSKHFKDNLLVPKKHRSCAHLRSKCWSPFFWTGVKWPCDCILCLCEGLWLGGKPMTEQPWKQSLPLGMLLGLPSLELSPTNTEASVSHFGLINSSFSQIGVLLHLPHPHPHREQVRCWSEQSQWGISS